MEKKVILITGASGGMGTALTNWFLKAGHQVAAHYFQGEPEWREGALFPVQADLRKEEEITAMIEQVIGHFGRIDVLINNAGITKSAMSWKMSAEDWRETMAINLDAPFLVSGKVIPSMRSNKFGRIINISSIVAQTGAVGTAAYAASKAGLIGLTYTLSKELAASGIAVNALALGYFSVGMIEDVPQKMQDDIIAKIPMGKLGDPETVCKTAEWLISDEAAYVTGQVISLNGGMHP